MNYLFFAMGIIAFIAAIGLITKKINSKPYCNHDWVEDVQSFKCSKCNKVIPNYSRTLNDAS